jgi:hypothetical protein
MSDKVQFSTFDRVINLHQSLKLSQINQTNKSIIAAQISQNQKLNELNYQLQEANSLHRQILQNQINEIQKSENQKFYKALIFNCIEIVEKIETITEENIRHYFFNEHFEKLKDSITNGKNELEEISDKTEANKWITKIENIKNGLSTNEYLKSPFFNFENAASEYRNIVKEMEEEINKLKSEIKMYPIPSKGLFGINKKRTEVALNERDQLISKLEKMISDKNYILMNHYVHKVYQEIIEKFSEFENHFNDIEEIENNFKKQFVIEKKNKKLDSITYDAAHIVVLHQQGSASILQRKLKIGYNRAARVIDQLEDIGVVSAFEGSTARRVLIKDSLELEQLFKKKQSLNN